MVDYEPVIGLEVHAQLATETKMFCGCPTGFGAPPNSQVCPVCLGMPGVLPVPNRRAFSMGVRVALALGSELPDETTFDRKNYSYPDLPKNYQISQNYRQLGTGGSLRLSSGKEVGIDNVHLEEDAGKLMHEEGSADAAVVDLNRAGTPLVEIVSDPDMRSVDEAGDYMTTLRDLLLYLDVCDCKMEEGSLRLEASISLRPHGQAAFGPRVEIKNLNSFAHVREAVRHEIDRQTRVLDEEGTVERETRLWDPDGSRTERMRSKEEAHDYRYFPEPDLVPLTIEASWLEELRADLPELRWSRRDRLVSEHGLSEYDATVLTETREAADYLEAVVAAGGDPKETANLMANDLKQAANDRGVALEELPVDPGQLASLLELVEGGTITKTVARREVLPAMVESGDDPGAIVEARDLAGESDREALEAVVREAVDSNPEALADWLGGKEAAAKAFMGPVMRETRGRADPGLVQEMIRAELESRRE